jgi:hypothetical protein
LSTLHRSQPRGALPGIHFRIRVGIPHYIRRGHGLMLS